MTLIYWLALAPLAATFWLCVSAQVKSPLGRQILRGEAMFLLKAAGTGVSLWLFLWGLSNLLSR